MTQPASGERPIESPKDASASVIAQHAATLKALPFSDTRDFDDASRGFLGTVENAHIANPQGIRGRRFGRVCHQNSNLAKNLWINPGRVD